MDFKHRRYRAEYALIAARLEAARARLAAWDNADETLRQAEHNLYQWSAEVRVCAEQVRAAELRLRWLRRDTSSERVRVAIEVPDALRPTYEEIASEVVRAHREGRERDHACALVFFYELQLACHGGADIHEVCRDAREEAAEIAHEIALTPPASKRDAN